MTNKEHIAESLHMKFSNGTEKIYQEIFQIFILGNFLTISATPLFPERGNVISTERFKLNELSSILIKFS